MQATQETFKNGDMRRWGKKLLLLNKPLTVVGRYKNNNSNTTTTTTTTKNNNTATPVTTTTTAINFNSAAICRSRKCESGSTGNKSRSPNVCLIDKIVKPSSNKAHTLGSGPGLARQHQRAVKWLSLTPETVRSLTPLLTKATRGCFPIPVNRRRHCRQAPRRERNRAVVDRPFARSGLSSGNTTPQSRVFTATGDFILNAVSYVPTRPDRRTDLE